MTPADRAASVAQAQHNHLASALADLRCATALDATDATRRACALAVATTQRALAAVAAELRGLDACAACGHARRDHVPFGGCMTPGGCSCGASDGAP